MMHMNTYLITGRLLFWAFVLLSLAALLYASGLLQVYEDGSFILRLAGCLPWEVCALP